MRILMVDPGPQMSVIDCHNGWLRAFARAGHTVNVVQLGDRLDFYLQAHLKKGRKYVKAFDFAGGIRQASKGIEVGCYEFWPDLVFITSCFYVPAVTMEIIRDRGHKIVIAHTESPYEDDRQLTAAPFADLNLINDPTHLDRFREVAPTEYQWHCYDPNIHRPVQPEAKLASNFAWIGTGFPERIEFFEKVDWSGIKPLFAGSWLGLEDDSPLRPFLAHNVKTGFDNKRTVAAYASTKMSANLYRTSAERPELSEGWSCGPREIELAACERFFLRQRRPESDELFPFLPTFETPAEFSDLLRYWLPRDDERADLARQARAAVKNRTFDLAVQRLLTLLP